MRPEVPSPQTGMQIIQQRGHLLWVKPPRKSRHHPSALQNVVGDRLIRRRNPAGQRLVLEQPMQIRRNLLQRQIIVLMAMRAAHLVKMLSFRLLGRQLLCRVAPAKSHAGHSCDCKTQIDQNPNLGARP